MQARSLLEGSFHTPETLKVLGEAFDDAWTEIAHRFNGDATKARLRLAHAVLAVALDNGQDPITLKNAALKVMALAYGDLYGPLPLPAPEPCNQDHAGFSSGHISDP